MLVFNRYVTSYVQVCIACMGTLAENRFEGFWRKHPAHFRSAQREAAQAFMDRHDPTVGSAMGCWLKEGWDWLFIFLLMVLK
jgi:hypothetical protein